MKKLLSYLHQKLILPIIKAKGDPSNIALGAFIGIFFGFSPFVGLQTILVFATIGLLRIFKVSASLPVGYALTWVSNPFTMIPLYFAQYKLGVFILSGTAITIAGFEKFINSITLENFFGKFFTFGAKIAIPLIIGFLISGIIAASLTFLLSYKLLKRKQRKDKEKEEIAIAKNNSALKNAKNLPLEKENKNKSVDNVDKDEDERERVVIAN